MSHLLHLSGLRMPLVFLKATVKKQVFVPTYTRHDGVTVPGHYASVHVSDAHDEHKILAGEGSFSQKAAHKQLTKHDWFHALPHDHKVAVLLKHATDIQDQASASATLSVFKKKILAGQTPTNAEWKAFDQVDPDKKAAINQEADNAGSITHLSLGYAKWKEATANAQPAPPQSTVAAPATNAAPPVSEPSQEPPEQKPSEPAKPTPKAVHAPATPHASVAAVLDKINAAKLPESNVNHKAVNAKLAAIHAAASAGDAKAILHLAFGSNTYAVKAVKLANEALAALGSSHQVSLTQKQGQHPAVHGSTSSVSPPETPIKAKPAKLVAASVAHKPASPVPDKVEDTASPSKSKPGFPLDLIPAFSPDISKQNKNAMMNLLLSGNLDKLNAFYDGIDPIKNPLTKLSCKQLIDLLKQYHAGTLGQDSDTGPKDGDTKTGKNGDTLVFHDGRWHLQNKSQSDSHQELSPDVTNTQEQKFTNTQPGHNKFWICSVVGNSLITHYGKIGTTGSHTKKEFSSAIQAQVAAHVLIKQKTAKGYQQVQGTNPGTPPVKKNVASAPYTPNKAKPVAAPPPVIKEGEIPVMDADGWLQTGPQKGSNSGGKFEDKQGNEWYCKFPDKPDVVKNELLAAKFYQMLGAKVPVLRLIKKDGKLGIASKWSNDLVTDIAKKLAKAPGAHDGFVFDAWLGNWDVVGMHNDNLMLDGNGAAVRVDVGGSLLYRAMGGIKGDEFGDTVPELETLLDPAKNSKTAAVFSGISKQSMKAGAETLAKMRNGQIKKMVDLFGPGDEATKEALTKTLIARRQYILDQFKVADPWNKPPPDMAALPVNQADLPVPIDFTNYKGSGSGLSSKALINKQNTIDDAALIAFAQKGNLTALKDYHYDAFDKSTGQSLGKKPITQHPNKDIKEHWAYLVDLLDSIAHPSVMGLDMPPLGGGTLAEVADAAGFIPFGQRVATISAEKRLGFWMKVAHAGDDFKDLVPKNTQWVSQSVKQASKQAWNKLSSVTKAFIAEVQMSGWINHIFSEGATQVSAQGNGGSYAGGLGGLAAAVYKDAIELEEGTKVTRWMQMPQAMMKQLLEEKPGLIFQNTDSMCTSMAEGWGNHAHFGNGAVLNIVYAKGAKAIHSFASGDFSGEQEITTLMGQRFMLIKATKGNPSNFNGITLDLLMLPPHQGFIADIEKHAKMGKAFLVFGLKALTRWWKGWK